MHVAITDPEIAPDLSLKSLVYLIPSSDGTATGVSEIGAWSALMRQVKRYPPPYNAGLELSGPAPPHANCVLHLLPDDAAIPADLKLIIRKVDVADNGDSFETKLHHLKRTGVTRTSLWCGEQVQTLVESAWKGHGQRELFHALVRGILLVLPYYVIQSREVVYEMMATLTEILYKQGIKYCIVNTQLDALDACDLFAAVREEHHRVLQGKASKFGVDGLQAGSGPPAGWHDCITPQVTNRALKALCHANMMLKHYTPSGVAQDEDGQKVDVKMTKSAKRLSAVKYHYEGGVVTRKWYFTWGARGYVLGTFVVSVLSGTLNWGNRSSAYEQVADFVQTLTVLWVSVFGLIKLTNEDDNAIRNTLRGEKILRSVHDVMGYAKCADMTELKRAMLRATSLEWLDPTDCGCLSVPKPGVIKVLGGFSITDLLRNGKLLLGDRLFASENVDEGDEIEFGEDGFIHILPNRRKKMQSNYPVVTDSILVK